MVTSFSSWGWYEDLSFVLRSTVFPGSRLSYRYIPDHNDYELCNGQQDNNSTNISFVRGIICLHFREKTRKKLCIDFVEHGWVSQVCFSTGNVFTLHEYHLHSSLHSVAAGAMARTSGRLFICFSSPCSLLEITLYRPGARRVSDHL